MLGCLPAAIRQLDPVLLGTGRDFMAVKGWSLHGHIAGGLIEPQPPGNPETIYGFKSRKNVLVGPTGTVALSLSPTVEMLPV